MRVTRAKVAIDERAERDRRHDHRAPAVGARGREAAASVTAKSRISRMPLQKVGMLCPTSTSGIRSRSTSVPRQTPAISRPAGRCRARRPARRPRGRACRAGGRRRWRRPARAGRATGRGRSAPGRPGSRAYWTRAAGRSRAGGAGARCPRASRPSGTSRSVGSPERCMTTKTIVDTPRIETTSLERRGSGGSGQPAREVAAGRRRRRSYCHFISITKKASFAVGFHGARAGRRRSRSPGRARCPGRPARGSRTPRGSA